MKLQNEIRKTVLFLAIVLGISACKIEIKESYDHTVDFSKYKTYCWMTGCEFKFNGPEYLYDSTVSEKIITALAQELESKGL